MVVLSGDNVSWLFFHIPHSVNTVLSTTLLSVGVVVDSRTLVEWPGRYVIQFHIHVCVCAIIHVCFVLCVCVCVCVCVHMHTYACFC